MILDETLVDEDTPSSGVEEEKEDSQANSGQDKSRHCCKKSGKLPPRTALKKLISKELESYAPQIFAELAKCKDLNMNPQTLSKSSSNINELQLRTH